MRARRWIPMTLSAAAAVLLFLLPGCGGGDGDDTTTTNTSSVQVFDETALEQPIEVDTGESFEIALDANNTTPYHWVFTTKPDPTVVMYGGRDYETDPNSEGLTGVGGTETFSFTAQTAGTTVIGLAYEELSGDGPTTERIDAKVTVR